jgi:hypothetical protein
MEPGNFLSQAFAMPFESTEHETLYSEMCKLKLLGNEGACRYYISALTGVDHFALWFDEYVDNVSEWVLAETRGAAKCFQFNSYTVPYMTPLLKAAYAQRHPESNVKLSECDIAVGLRLRNPNWSDEQIAETVPTTVSQLRRWSDYIVLGASNFRAVDEDEGVALISAEQLHQEIRMLIAGKSGAIDSSDV